MLSDGVMMRIAEAAAPLELHRAAVEAGGILAQARHILERRHGGWFRVVELLALKPARWKNEAGAAWNSKSGSRRSWY